jgi:hypothetical protein
MYATRTPRGYRTALTVGTAEALGCDPEGGKWVVICEAHGTLVNVDTRAVAMAIRADDFCEEEGH